GYAGQTARQGAGWVPVCTTGSRISMAGEGSAGGSASPYLQGMLLTAQGRLRRRVAPARRGEGGGGGRGERGAPPPPPRAPPPPPPAPPAAPHLPPPLRRPVELLDRAPPPGPAARRPRPPVARVVHPRPVVLHVADRLRHPPPRVVLRGACWRATQPRA